MFKKNSIKYLLRRRIKIFTVVVMILSSVFICYQLLYFKQLNNQLSITSPNLIRGINPHETNFYIPKSGNKFTCILSFEVIEFSRVNDDYCDCADGSDEPGTNACSNAKFYCLHQDSMGRYKKVIPSNMVNDGICDCCDGSDEFNADALPFRLDDLLQRKLGRYQTPCTNYCLK